MTEQRLQRRGFLGGLLAAAVAPAIIRAGLLMPIPRRIWWADYATGTYRDNRGNTIRLQDLLDDHYDRADALDAADYFTRHPPPLMGVQSGRPRIPVRAALVGISA